MKIPQSKGQRDDVIVRVEGLRSGRPNETAPSGAVRCLDAIAIGRAECGVDLINRGEIFSVGNR
jgi:hypothetical protein